MLGERLKIGIFGIKLSVRQRYGRVRNQEKKIGGMLTWQLWPVCAQLTMTTMERAVTPRASGAQISNKASSKLSPSILHAVDER